MSLWTSKHTPENFDDIIQEDVIPLLKRVKDGRLNAVLFGPKGSGKTVAVRALAHETFGDEDALFVLNASDFFSMTKDEIADDPRFRHFISAKRKRTSSKADMMNHVLKEIASHSTVEDDFKILLIDNAEEMRPDFQQALRRVMERYTKTCQFILTTRSTSALIPPILSRCFQVPFSSPTKDSITERLNQIAEAEDLNYSYEGLEYIAEDSDGNIRKAILMLQTAAERHGEVTMDTVYDVLEETGSSKVKDMIESAYNGNFDDAVDVLDLLLIDQGYSGREVLTRVVNESDNLSERKRAKLVKKVGEAETDLSEGKNDRIHIERLLSSLA